MVSELPCRMIKYKLIGKDCQLEKNIKNSAFSINRHGKESLNLMECLKKFSISSYLARLHFTITIRSKKKTRQVINQLHLNPNKEANVQFGANQNRIKRFLLWRIKKVIVHFHYQLEFPRNCQRS